MRPFDMQALGCQKGSVRLACLIAGLCASTGLAPLARAQAAQKHVVSIGAINATKTCTTYMMEAGHSSLSVSRHSIYAEDSWRSWLVRDCVSNFATMRGSLVAALASSGKFAVGGGGYKVNLTISDIGDRTEATGNALDYDPAAYGNVSGSLFVNIDVTITDKAGRAVFGGILTKSIKIGSVISANGFSTAQSQDGEGAYGVLQHEAALAAARVVVFHIEPIRVTGRSGNQVRLSYGQPLLPVGSSVQIRSRNGFDDIKYRVISASAGNAIAEKEGDGDSAVDIGSSATFTEGDDPAENGRRTKREELP